MKKNNFIKLFIYSYIILLSLSGCDEYSTYTIEIRNKTSDTIWIYYAGTTSYTNGADTVLSLPNANTIYYNSEGSKIKSKNHDCDPQISKNEVIVKISNNKKLKKDISDKNNWECETNNNNTYWNMYFTVEEEDLK